MNALHLEDPFTCDVPSCDGFGRRFALDCPHWDYDDVADYREQRAWLLRFLGEGV